MDRWNEFFTLYNAELASVYDRELEGLDQDAPMNDPDFQEQLRNQVLNSMQAWYKKSFESLGDTTPEAMIDAIENVEEAVLRLKQAAVFCDDDIPEYLKIKLGSFGEEALPALVRTALDPSWEGDYTKEETPSAEVLAAAFALKLLGEWQAAGPLDAIVEKFMGTKTPNELIAEAFRLYVNGVGALAATCLTEALTKACRDGEAFSEAHEYALIALTQAGAAAQSDGAFACLRACFRAMEYKTIGAICLGDYGDPRGITVMKSYLDANPDRYDRSEFYEILSSIKRLGGSISDIRDPFRDFSAR